MASSRKNKRFARVIAFITAFVLVLGTTGPITPIVAEGQFTTSTEIVEGQVQYYLSTLEIQEQVNTALDYVYPDGYEYNGNIVVENNTFTGTYIANSLEELEFAMNDVARYLGALYRQEGSNIETITFNDTDYTWNEEGTLKGSNWADDSGNTLVSQIVSSYQNDPAADIDVILSNPAGETLPLTFVLEVIATRAEVSTLDELKTALENTEITDIVLVSDIDTTENKILISRPVNIDGAGHSINFVGDTDGWQSNYVLHVWNTNDVVISDITLTGGDGALLVGSANVTLEGTIDVSGNEFGGIESSQSGNIETLPALDVSGATFVNSTEVLGQPTIWEDQVSGTVTTADGQFTTSTEIVEGQVQYYLSTLEIQEQVNTALDYVYPDGYEYNGNIVVENNTFTGTYIANSLEELEFAMNDVARYLGALYRQEGSNIETITFNDTDYTWNEEGTLKGSNWADDSGNTLVSQIVASFQSNPATDIELTLSNVFGETLPLTFVLEVLPVLVEGVSLDKTEVELLVGGTETLTATVSPEYADNKGVTWTSSDESVATVVDGVVTALGVGTTTITVTTEDGEHTATAEVTVTLPVDFSALETALEEAEAVVEEDYTEETYSPLADAITTGNEVLANPDATQEEVYAAVTAIEEAIAGLEEIPGFEIGLEIRDLDGTRTTEVPVTVTDAEGIEVVGDFNQYGQWISAEELPEGTYTITLVTPEGTVAEINESGTQAAVATNEDNVFTIDLNEETLGSLSAVYGAFRLVEVEDPVEPEFTAALGVEVRDLDNERTSEVTVTVADADGVEVEGDFDEYGRWLSTDELPEGTYTITLVTPEGTVAEVNDTVATQAAVATAEENVFTIDLNEENLGSLSRLYGAFRLVEVETPVEPELEFRLGVEVRDLDNERTREATITVTNANGEVVVGDFNEYAQWLTTEELPEGVYTITLVTPEGTVAEVNDTVSTQSAVATEVENVFTLVLNEENLGNLSAVYGAFRLVELPEEKVELVLLDADEMFDGVEDITLSTNGEIDTLEEVVVIIDGERHVLTSDQFTAVSGSTIITIPAEVLNELGVVDGNTFTIEVSQSEGVEHLAGTVSAEVTAVIEEAPITEFSLGVEVRGLDGTRTTDVTVTVTNTAGEVIEGSFNEYGQWLSTNELAEGAYTITLETPEGTVAVVNTSAAAQAAVATNVENVFMIDLNLENLGNLSAVYGAFSLVEDTTEETTEPSEETTTTTPEETTQPSESTTPSEEPTEPSGTVDPTEESTDATTTGEDVTQTGESSAPIMFAVLALIVAAGLVVISVRRRRDS